MTRMFASAALAAAVLAAVTAGGPAEAGKRGSSNWSEVNVEVPGPTKGYSGFVSFGGAKSAYCDYQRHPNRQCSIDSRGRESCRIVSWTLKQSCS